jgi:hypothetical protein
MGPKNIRTIKLVVLSLLTILCGLLLAFTIRTVQPQMLVVMAGFYLVVSIFLLITAIRTKP